MSESIKPAYMMMRLERSDREAYRKAPQKVKLFDGLVFVLGRESPFEVLAMAVESNGGKVIWEEDNDTSMNDHCSFCKDHGVTHVVCDRPE